MMGKKPSIISLLFLSAFSTLPGVLFTPAFPAIKRELGISTSLTQMTMTIFLLGYALGNLPYGPTANRFGRKPTLLAGITIAFLGSIIVAMVSRVASIDLLLLGRFLMGFGASVGIKIATTMIGDAFSESEARHVTPQIVLTFAIVPGLAIFIGGILTQYLGWQSCLYFLVAYCLFQFFISINLPETAPKLDRHALNLKIIGEKYGKELKSPIVMAMALMLGLGTSYVYLFAAESPFIGIQYLGLTPQLFGMLNFIPSIGMAAGSFFSRIIATKHTGFTVLKWGIGIICISSLVMVFLFGFGMISTYTLFAPISLIYFGLSLVFSNALAIGISHAKDKSAASSVLNFINILVSVILLSVLSMFSTHHFIRMPLLFTTAGILLVSCLIPIRKRSQ